jgi:hypothetical protein
MSETDFLTQDRLPRNSIRKVPLNQWVLFHASGCASRPWQLIRALELKLEIFEHGLGMPRDEYAIAQTKAMLEQARLEHELYELATL